MKPRPLESNASYVAACKSLRNQRHSLRLVAGYLLPEERVKGCGRKRHGQTVDIHRSARGAHFAGVETCGSVWHCPVCAARIAEKRRQEVSQAITGAEEAGGAAYMLTLTMRHARSDELLFLKQAIADGWRKVQNRRAYRKFKAQFGILGTVRAIEVTHGNANGWHPHLHVLFITKRSFEEQEIKEAESLLFELWTDVLGSLTGRYVALDALDFRPAKTSDYVTKWGADRELVKGQQKEGNQSRSPWQLLRAFKNGDKRAGRLFKEYARVFKGAQQLTWSKGLKAAFHIGELTDEEAANSVTEEDSSTLPDQSDLPEGRIGVLDKETFDAVVRLKLTAQVLDAAHAGGWQAVLSLLKKHGLKPKWPNSDDLKQHEPPPRECPSFMKWYRVHSPLKNSSNSGLLHPEIPAGNPDPETTQGTPLVPENTRETRKGSFREQSL